MYVTLIFSFVMAMIMEKFEVIPDKSFIFVFLLYVITFAVINIAMKKEVKSEGKNQ